MAGATTRSSPAPPRETHRRVGGLLEDPLEGVDLVPPEARLLVVAPGGAAGCGGTERRRSAREQREARKALAGLSVQTGRGAACRTDVFDGPGLLRRPAARRGGAPRGRAAGPLLLPFPCSGGERARRAAGAGRRLRRPRGRPAVLRGGLRRRKRRGMSKLARRAATFKARTACGQSGAPAPPPWAAAGPQPRRSASATAGGPSGPGRARRRAPSPVRRRAKSTAQCVRRAPCSTVRDLHPDEAAAPTRRAPHLHLPAAFGEHFADLALLQRWGGGRPQLGGDAKDACGALSRLLRRVRACHGSSSTTGSALSSAKSSSAFQSSLGCAGSCVTSARLL